MAYANVDLEKVEKAIEHNTNLMTWAQKEGNETSVLYYETIVDTLKRVCNGDFE